MPDKMFNLHEEYDRFLDVYFLEEKRNKNDVLNVGGGNFLTLVCLTE